MFHNEFYKDKHSCDPIAGPSVIKLNEADDFSYACRICATSSYSILSLFEKECMENKLVEKINKYLPIKVSKDDLLPSGICEQCSNAILTWHELVERCLKADATFRKQLTLTKQVSTCEVDKSIVSEVQEIDDDGINFTNETNIENSFFSPERMDINNIEKPLSIKKREQLYRICNLCNKKILASSQRRHLRTHQNEKSYSCDTCGLGFKDSSNLSRHKRSIHYNLRPHVCNICSKRFYRNSHLKDHVQSHLERPQLVCDICGKSSKSKNALRMHTKLHEAVHEFNCVFCSSKFKRKSELYAHLSVHTGEKAYPCYCGKRFRLRSQLNRHTLSHTKKSADVNEET